MTDEVRHSEEIRKLLDDALGGQMQPVKELIEECFPSVNEFSFCKNNEIEKSFAPPRAFFALDLKEVRLLTKDCKVGEVDDQGTLHSVHFSEGETKYEMFFLRGRCYSRKLTTPYNNHLFFVIYQTAIDYDDLVRLDVRLDENAIGRSSCYDVDPLTKEDVKRVIGDFPYRLIKTGRKHSFITKV